MYADVWVDNQPKQTVGQYKLDGMGIYSLNTIGPNISDMTLNVLLSIGQSYNMPLFQLHLGHQQHFIIVETTYCQLLLVAIVYSLQCDKNVIVCFIPIPKFNIVINNYQSHGSSMLVLTTQMLQSRNWQGDW